MAEVSLSSPLVEGHFADDRRLEPLNLSHLFAVHAMRSLLFRQVHAHA
jgi:hypothetical protein